MFKEIPSPGDPSAEGFSAETPPKKQNISQQESAGILSDPDRYEKVHQFFQEVASGKREPTDGMYEEAFRIAKEQGTDVESMDGGDRYATLLGIFAKMGKGEIKIPQALYQEAADLLTIEKAVSGK